MLRGQALVEFALVVPILLVLLLGIAQLGVVMVLRLELTHAATEAVVAGAIESNPAERCPTALAVLAEIYGRNPDDATCQLGPTLEVTATVVAPELVPGVADWTITVSERAIAR